MRRRKPRRNEADRVEQVLGSPAPHLPGYDSFSVVGIGGFAIVYRARQSAFNRTVAVKVLSRRLLDGRAFRLFDRERIALGSLSSHPNIVTVYDSGFTRDGAPYLSMEYMPLGSLADLFCRGPLEWREAVRIGVKLSGALETAHRAGVLHRDLKPENVLMSGFREPQLADFGIARLLGSGDTNTAAVNMSVPFAPPEIIDGESPSVQSDIYSLSCTIHSLILGHPSFVDDDDDRNGILQLTGRIRTEPPADLRPLGAPDAICRVIERALAKRPEDRHVAALDFGMALREAEELAGETPTTLAVDGATLVGSTEEMAPTDAPTLTHDQELRSPATATEAFPPHTSRRRRWPAAAVLLLIVSGGGSAAAFLSRDKEPRPPATTTTSSSDTTASTTTSVAVATSAVPQPSPRGSSALPAGIYRTVGLRHPVTMTLDAGWRTVATRNDVVFGLALADDTTAQASLFLMPVDEVFDPGPEYLTVQAAAKGIRPRPADVVTWLRSHPRFTTTMPRAVEGWRVPAVRIDAVVTESYSYPSCSSPCVMLFNFENEWSFGVLKSERLSFYVLDVAGAQVVAVVSAPLDSFDAFSARSTKLLGTLAPAAG